MRLRSRLLARGIYRLNPAAWWSTVLLIVLGLVNSLTTFSRVDPFDVYRLSGSPPQQIEMMQQIGMPSRATMILPTVLYGVGLRGDPGDPFGFIFLVLYLGRCGRFAMRWAWRSARPTLPIAAARQSIALPDRTSKTTPV